MSNDMEDTAILTELERQTLMVFKKNLCKRLDRRLPNISMKHTPTLYSTERLLKIAMQHDPGAIDKAMVETISDLLAPRSTAAERELQTLWTMAAAAMPGMNVDHASANKFITDIVKQYAEYQESLQRMVSQMKKIKLQIVLNQRYRSMPKPWRTKSIKPQLLTGSSHLTNR